MKSEIRQFEICDYEQVGNLLQKYDLETWSLDEMNSGFGYVARVNGKIVGFIWGLIAGKIGIIDHLVVDEDYRDKGAEGRTLIGYELAIAMFAKMVANETTLFFAVINDNKYNHSLLRFYRDKLGMKERKVLTIVKGKPTEVLRNLEVFYDSR